MIHEPRPTDGVKHEITVRRLRASDRDGWQRLWEQYLSFYRAELPSHMSDHTFTRLCDDDDSVIGLLALDSDREAVGLAHLIFHPTNWAVAPDCYLEDKLVLQ